MAQRRRQVAEIEMDVGVDQSRQNGDVAQVADSSWAAHVRGRLHHRADDSLRLRCSPLPSGIGSPVDGKHVAGAKSSLHTVETRSRVRNER